MNERVNKYTSLCINYQWSCCCNQGQRRRHKLTDIEFERRRVWQAILSIVLGATALSFATHVREMCRIATDRDEISHN
jgi:hypothetical protein